MNLSDERKQVKNEPVKQLINQLQADHRVADHLAKIVQAEKDIAKTAIQNHFDRLNLNEQLPKLNDLKQPRQINLSDDGKAAGD